MPTTSKKGSNCNLTAGDTASDANKRAQLRAMLSGFEGRLRRCRREVEGFLDEHWDEARHRSELAFLLGQMHGVIAHCRDLEGRYRDEQVCVAARDGVASVAAPDGHAQAAWAGGSRAAACG